MVKKALFFLSRYKWACLTGLLVSVSYIPFPPFAVVFCFVPLWLFALQQKRLKHLLIGGWLCQMLITWGGGYWIAYTIKEFGGFSWPQASLLFALFSCGANLQIPLALLLWFMCHKILLSHLPSSKTKNSLLLLLLPTTQALCMMYFPNLFKWHLGYTWFYAGLPLFQTAELWGFSFLNTLTLFSNLLFLVLWQKIKPLHPPPLFGVFKSLCESLKKLNSFSTGGLVILWLVIFLSLNLLGLYLKNRWPEPTHQLSALIVQPNIKPPSSSHVLRSKKNQMHTLFQESVKGIKSTSDPVDFILWPEGSFPYIIKDHPGFSFGRSQAASSARLFDTSLILSAIRKQKEGHSNSLFIFNAEGKEQAPPYDKIHLIAFGEYWPKSMQWLPFIKKIYPNFGYSFLKGLKESSTAYVFQTQVGFQICYEGLFDSFSRKLAQKGARILINTSNDRWFGKTSQPHQHLYMTLARGIENRLPVLRGTNSGFSAVMTAKGQILYQSPLWQKSHKTQILPFNKEVKLSFFSSYGHYINPILLLGFLVLTLLLGLKSLF